MSPDWLIFQSIEKLGGGEPCFFLTCYAYMADITRESKRMPRLLILNLAFQGAKILGAALSPVLFNNVGYILNCSLAVTLDIIGISLLVFIVKESNPKSKEEKGDKQSIWSYATGLFKDTGKMLKKKRDNGLRHILWLLITVFAVQGIAMGDHSTDVPYIRRKFDWATIEDFNVWFGTVCCKTYS